MKKLLIASASIAALAASGAAMAADMAPAYKAPPPPMPVFSWTGFYFGGNAGSGWGTKDETLEVGPFGPVPANSLALAQVGINGFLAGGQVGYNWQWGWAVFGIEGDFDWADLHGTAPCLVVVSCSAKVNWVADLTARLGFTAVENRALIYIKGGAAWDQTDFTDNITLALPGGPFSATGAGSQTRFGWLLGTGIEYAFAPNWSAKVEYDFIDFGTFNVPLNVTATIPLPPGLPAFSSNVDERIHMIKFGLNYRFNWGGGPVVANY